MSESMNVNENWGAIVGSGSRVTGSIVVKNTQTHNTTAGNSPLDLNILAEELSKLRITACQHVTDAEHGIAIGALSAAEVAAKQGDRTKTMQALAKAGQWVLDLATKIGSTVASDALKAALGIK